MELVLSLEPSLSVPWSVNLFIRFDEDYCQSSTFGGQNCWLKMELDIGNGLARWTIPHPGFGRSVYPISTRGSRLCPPTLLLAHPALCSFLRRWWTVVSVWLLSFYLAELTKIGLNFGKWNVWQLDELWKVVHLNL